jgi:hypothetical protein
MIDRKVHWHQNSRCNCDIPVQAIADLKRAGVTTIREALPTFITNEVDVGSKFQKLNSFVKENGIVGALKLINDQERDVLINVTPQPNPHITWHTLNTTTLGTLMYQVVKKATTEQKQQMVTYLRSGSCRENPVQENNQCNDQLCSLLKKTAGGGYELKETLTVMIHCTCVWRLFFPKLNGKIPKGCQLYSAQTDGRNLHLQYKKPFKTQSYFKLIKDRPLNLFNLTKPRKFGAGLRYSIGETIKGNLSYMIKHGLVQTGAKHIKDLRMIPLIFIDPGIDPIATITVVRLTVVDEEDENGEMVLVYRTESITKTFSSGHKYQAKSMQASLPKKFAACQGKPPIYLLVLEYSSDLI